MKTEYSVTLTNLGAGQYTAYLGTSRKRAYDTMDIVRNTLIRTGSTGMITLRADYVSEGVQVIVNGAWNPTKTELPVSASCE